MERVASCDPLPLNLCDDALVPGDSCHFLRGMTLSRNNASYPGPKKRSVCPSTELPIYPFLMSETCAICSCQLHREGDYAVPSAHGRSHATKHHYVAERFFGRSKNRQREVRKGIFTVCPWAHEKKSVVLCYECHEELIHNPVFLAEDIERFAALVRKRGLSEDLKPDDRLKLAGRIRLLREIIDAGLSSVMSEESGKHTPEPP